MASYLLRNSPAPTSEQKFTFSTWLKLSSVSTAADNGIVEWYKSANDRHQILIDSATRQLRCYSVEGGVVKINIYSDIAFRDCNGWYHIVIQSDNTLASSSDRFKLWVNGVAQTFASYSWTFGQNLNINVFDGSGTRLNLGTRNEAYANWLNGLLADTYYIDGSIIAPTEFGEEDANGVWIPKIDPTIASFGNAGFHLKYENSGTIGLDSSGNGNNFSTSGTVTQSVDTPSNVYATMNPLNKGANVTLSNGNLTCVGSGTYVAVSSTLAVNTGKWYWEAKCNTASPDNRFNVGILKTTANMANTPWIGSVIESYGYLNDGTIYNNGSQLLNTGTTVSVGDIVGFLLDLDNGTLKLKKNGSDVYSGNAVVSSLNTGDYWYVAQGADVSNVDFNFGNGYFGTTAVASAGSNGNGSIFEYDVPTGYYALNTKNLATYG